MTDQDGIKLIVGLGNPGPHYDQTRHNAGFWFVDALAQQFQATFRQESKFLGHVGRVNINGTEVWLLKPATYMNRSGQSLRACAAFYKISLPQVLVAHDEIDLPPGKTKLKRGGGHGGHNGLRDIVAHLGNDFWRLRLGVGHPGHRDLVIDYVLSRSSKDDEALIRANIAAALELMPLIIAGEMEKAMHQLHSKN